MKPEKIVCKIDPDDSEYEIVTLYGIDFKFKEGTVEGKMPLQEISVNHNIPLETLKCVLKKYSLLTEDDKISHGYCPMEPTFTHEGKTHDTAPYPGLVMTYVYDPDREGSTKECNFSDIYGHEQFIVDLYRRDIETQIKYYSREVNLHVIKINSLLTKAALKGIFPDVEVNNGSDRNLKHATIYVTFFPRERKKSEDVNTEKRQTPEKIVFKKELEEFNNLCELYGIEFSAIEGGVSDKKTLDEIAKMISIDISGLQSILREYSLLDEDNEISKEECVCESFLEGADCEGLKINYSCVVLSKVYVAKKDDFQKGKFKESDFQIPEIYGNVQFITELVKKSEYNKFIGSIVVS